MYTLQSWFGRKTRAVAVSYTFMTLAFLAAPRGLAKEEESVPVTPTVRAPRYGGPERWENGLDVKTTGFFGKKPGFDGSSPVILSAQWNRRYETWTYIGLSLSSMAQPSKGPYVDLKSTIMSYYGGLNLAQGLVEWGEFRFAATVSAGLGSIFIRTQSDLGTSRMNRADFRYVEPGAYMTFFEYAGLEFGLAGTYRIVKLLGDYTQDELVLGTSKDFSSPAFGLTFRTKRR